MQQFNEKFDKILRVAKKFENTILATGVDFATGVIEPLEVVAKVANAAYEFITKEKLKKDEPVRFGDMVEDIRDEEKRRRDGNDEFFRRAFYPHQDQG